jgi:hypothetical protein
VPLPVPIQTSDPASVENACRVILRKAETRQFTGGIMFLAKADGSMETILVGDLHRDLDKAKDVAEHGVKCLLGHKACIEGSGAQLPRRLRKDQPSANDHICHVTACSMRR